MALQTLFPWIGLIALILSLLALDLGVFNRVPHVISTREAFSTSCLWISFALLFNLFVLQTQGIDAGLAFFTGYLLEKLLSLDNMFVFIVIFNFFQVSPRHQHRVLFWGVLGAIIFRLLLILVGIELIKTFEWILYLFGALLIYSSYKIFSERSRPVKIETNAILLWAKKYLPFQENYKGRRFFLHLKRGWVITPLFLVLITLEATDIVFAIDSIPAIFAITLDPFIVFTSNIFALLGLRALYFLLARLIPRFYYFQHALAIILGFVGAKLVLANHIKIPLVFSLSVIICTLSVAIIASLWKNKHGKNPH
ncbi:MAG: TerC/Alx family metal homeostasis membrane protein [Proteobacteria bacterium]|nr:TerC/Alx family metal homeostasis membrane protein [Pseudomonadota bacterium]